MERLNFQKTAYWGVLAETKKTGSPAFSSRLIEHNKKTLARSADFDSKTGHLKNKKSFANERKRGQQNQNPIKRQSV